MRHLLVDASHLAYRCRFADVGSLRTAAGKPSGVVYGFLRGMDYALRQTNSDIRNAIVVWDGGRSAKRQELCPSYKESRRKHGETETPEESLERKNFYLQMESLRKGLSLIGARSLHVEGTEADDIISLVATSIEHRGEDAVVFSGDKDMQQLIARDILVFHPQHGIIDCNKFREIWGFDDPADIVNILSLIGDKSDDIDGVKGVGAVRAALVLPLWEYIWDDKEKPVSIDEKTWKWVVVCRENREIIERNIKIIRLPRLWEESFYSIDFAVTVASQLEHRSVRDLPGFMAWCGEWEISDLNLIGW